MMIFLNDRFLNAKNAKISIDNRSFRYGDGFFETIKYLNGRIPLWEYHARRIRNTLHALHFEPPGFFTTNYIRDHIETLVRKNQHEYSARIRVTIFRGDGGIYDDVSHYPQCLIQSWHLPLHHNEMNNNGLVLGLYREGMKSADKFANLKTNNYLLYAMAALFARKAHCNDALVLNHRGDITDATIANCWIIKNGECITPPLTDGPVAGTMRQFLLDHLEKKGFVCREKTIPVTELLEAEALFLSNAIYGIRWVGEFDGRKYGQKMVSDLFAGLVQPLWTSTL